MGVAAAVCGAAGRHKGARTCIYLTQKLDGSDGPVGRDGARKRIRLPLGCKRGKSSGYGRMVLRGRMVLVSSSPKHRLLPLTKLGSVTQR